MEPGEARAVAHGKILFRARAQFLDASDHLVAGNDGKTVCDDIAFDKVQVGSAHPARGHAHQNFAGAGPGRIRLNEVKRTRINGRGLEELNRSHGIYSTSSEMRCAWRHFPDSASTSTRRPQKRTSPSATSWRTGNCVIMWWSTISLRTPMTLS